MNLDKLEYLRTQKLGACSRCPLCLSRKWIVFGTGNPEADLMFVGEAPGVREDASGKPFVGPAGHLLDKVLRRIGLDRASVYITNVLKCQPFGNRDPEELEIAKCSPFLHAQIGLIQPKAIVTLGRFAGNLLVDHPTKQPMRLLASMSPWTYTHPTLKFQIPVYAAYHPAFILRQLDKPDAKDHLRAFVNTLVRASQGSEPAADVLF